MSGTLKALSIKIPILNPNTVMIKMNEKILRLLKITMETW